MATTVRRVLCIAALTALTTLAAAPRAFAVNTVTQTVTAGTLTASVADVALGAVSITHSTQASVGVMTLTADDSTGSGAGWKVTEQVSAFVYTGSNGGADIPAANFSITSANAPAATAGQAIDATGTDGAPTGPQVGNKTSGVSGTLDAPIVVLRAGAGFGQGTYTEGLNVSLAVPADSRAGTYTGTLTTSITAGP